LAELALEARGIGFRVLDAVSVHVRPGEFVVVLGPNGAGKSTLLKVLSGECRPAAGEVVLDGKVISSWPSRMRARAIAVLPQSSLLNANFRGLDVALMGRTPHVESRRDRPIALAALTSVDGEHLAARMYPKLSGGEQQRVQLARVLAQIWEPLPSGGRYLLLDEPTANLDLAHQHRTLQVAHKMMGEGVGVFAVMHDLNLAARHATRILLLKDGRVVAEGAPRKVLTPELISATFSWRVDVLQHPHLRIPLIVPE
jgi:iron complex transport system ATP-binding protein